MAELPRRDVAGLCVVVENPSGSVRTWKDPDGNVSGSTIMRCDYGFIEGVVGSDGEDLDCYVGPDAGASFVYVVHQRKAPGFTRHDEDKVFLQFSSAQAAEATFWAHRQPGEQRLDPGPLGGMSTMPLERFLAKLKRRRGTGKIRANRTEEPTMQRPRRQSPRERPLFYGRAVAFVASPVAGSVRVGCWDRFTSWGKKIKQGVETDFNEATLGQMVSNFGAQKNDIYMDYDHQTVHVEANGQPAIALAWYNALVAVREGKVFAFATHDPSVLQPDGAGLEDGVHGYRYEVTDAGQELLGGGKFKFLSPLFDVAGADEHGNALGYLLYCVAATNNPFQDDVPITFSNGARMAKPDDDKTGSDTDKALAKRLGLDDDASPSEMRAAMKAHLAKLDADTTSAQKKMDDDAAAMKKKFDDEVAGYKAKLAKFDDGDASAMDDSEVAADDSDGAPALAKMAKALGLGKTTPKKILAAFEAKYTPPTSVAKLQQEIASMRAERDAEKQAESERRFSALADRAIGDGGYDKEKRSSLINFARVDFKGAEEFVDGLVERAPKGRALGRLTSGGAPAGTGRTASDLGEAAPGDGTIPESGAAMSKRAHEIEADERKKGVPIPFHRALERAYAEEKSAGRDPWGSGRR